MNVTVIVTTYNRPFALKKVLNGLASLSPFISLTYCPKFGGNYIVKIDICFSN